MWFSNNVLVAHLQTLAEFLGTDQPAAVDPVEQVPLTIKDFCQGILHSREYRQSIRDRIILGTLPSAIELRFYDYAEGKPAERHELSGKDGEPLVFSLNLTRPNDDT